MIFYIIQSLNSYSDFLYCLVNKHFTTRDFHGIKMPFKYIYIFKLKHYFCVVLYLDCFPNFVFYYNTTMIRISVNTLLLLFCNLNLRLKSYAYYMCCIHFEVFGLISSLGMIHDFSSIFLVAV